MKLGITGVMMFGMLVGLSAHDPHWTYEGKGAPAHWGDLSDDFHACKYGKYQSPIDITTKLIKETTQSAPIEFAYKNEAENIVNNGHSLQVNFKKGSALKLDNETYPLVQMHFHTPLEYTINGQHYPMEAHVVHQTDKGQILVFSLLFSEGKENPTIAQIFNNAPKKSGDTISLSTVDLANLVGKTPSYTRLDGSLTTPPCSEGVIWVISGAKVEASKAQIATFKKIIGTNNRPVQPANGRVLLGVKTGE